MIDSYTPLTDHRYERKFVTNTSNKGHINVLLRNNIAAFHEIYVPRRVNNIYFDTPGLNCYYDNLFGIGNRWKARIRWYGTSLNEIVQPILELKIKNGYAGTKKSWELKPFLLSGNLNDKQVLKKCLIESDLPEEVRGKLLAMQPVLINNYDRSYFLSADKRFRLTVDTDIAYRDFVFIHRSDRKMDKEHDKVVIELKYAKEFDKDAISITDSFPFRLDKNSKFVSGMRIIRPGVAE